MVFSWRVVNTEYSFTYTVYVLTVVENMHKVFPFWVNTPRLDTKGAKIIHSYAAVPVPCRNSRLNAERVVVKLKTEKSDPVT
jgi:hypothetical protein